MSEQQKIFASLSGAVVAHLVLLLFIFVLLSTKSIGSSLKGAQAPGKKEPKEVTILMSELMERIEVEKTAEEPPVEAARPFVSADLNQAEAIAPENARFESDRNTSAAAELRPDESLPREAVPTLAGDSPLPHLTLQNRQFVEGPLNQAASAAAAPSSSGSGAASPAASPSFPLIQNPSLPANPEALPDPPKEEGDRDQARDGEKAAPRERIADRRDRPKGLEIGNNEGDSDEVSAETGVQPSFVVPTSDPQAVTLGKVAAAEDRFAAKDGEMTGEGKMTDSVQRQDQPSPLKAGEEIPPERPPSDPARPSEAGSIKAADEGLFDKGFSPEERQNVINGSLAKTGQNAVDAEETALGRYKKAVRDAISAKWNRYRQDNADFVTWGILKLQFSVDAKGRVNDLQITKNEANAMLAEFSLKAIREADLPPMPEDVARSVGSKGLVIQYDIIIY